MRRMMKSFTPALTGAAIGLALVAGPVSAEEAKETKEAKGETELAELLEGRVAGEPVRCIRQFASDRMRTIDRTAYVYGSGKTIYVQRTRHPDRIDDDDILVIRKFGGSQLCRLDQITTVDRTSGFFNGAVFFDDFVPYTRVTTEDEADT
ncbi:MAG: hypothetical protein AAGK02_04295 [Pseudomonadota bacterium]